MKRTIGLCLTAALLLCLVGCGVQPEPAKKRQASFLNLFDTVTVVVGYAETETQFEQEVQDIHDRLRVYHELYDVYNDYDGVHNIKTINDNAGVAPVQVDARIIELLLFARQAYTLTGGVVNVAMGSVLSVWHDYRTAGLDDPANAALPPMALLQEAAQHTDIDDLVIDEAASTVYLADPDMRLDVGAVAKGYAVQRVCDELLAADLDRYLLSVGGNVCTVGAKDADGTPWSVGIQDPYDLSAYGYTVALAEGSVVTSGNYQRSYTVDGQSYHHIIDPATLMPAVYFDAVSIVCVDSGLADALSTALYIMPYEAGAALIESIEGAEAIWIVDEETVKFSSGFEAMLQA